MAFGMSIKTTKKVPPTFLKVSRSQTTKIKNLKSKKIIKKMN